MRILFCNYEYPPLGGGGGVINKDMAEELAKKHTVHVLTSQGMGLPSVRVENGVTVFRVPVFFRSRQAAANMPSMLAFLPSGYLKGRKLIEEHNYDIINTHFAVPTGPVGKWLAKKAKIPNVLCVHGGDLYDPSKWASPHRHSILRSIVRGVLRKADTIIGGSSNTVENIHTYYDSEVKAECIPYAIQRQDDVVAAPRDRYGIADDDLVFVTVGRLVSRKGLDQLIEVMSKLNNKKVHLFVIGSGPLEEPLKALSQELGLAEQIHFLGQVDDQEKLEVLHMADIYTSTSVHEGFGIVFLEAMAAGLPVVCYDFGGQTDFLETDSNGYVVKLNDKAAFQKACQQLIDDPALRVKMSKHNQKTVTDYYIDRYAEKYEAIYKNAIATHKS